MRNSKHEYLAVPVLNFPVLPLGSRVYFSLTERVYVESASIEGYTAHSKGGTEIDIKLDGNGNMSPEDIDQHWQSIAELCIRDETNVCDFIYPKAINFGLIRSAVAKA